MRGKFIFMQLSQYRRRRPRLGLSGSKNSSSDPTLKWQRRGLPPPSDLQPLAGMLKGLKIADRPFKFHPCIPEITSVMLRVNS